MEGVRKRVIGPGEEAPADDFYLEARGSEDSRVPKNMTALREAERRFKGNGWEERVKTEALDFSQPENNPRIKLADTVQINGRMLSVYEVEGCPGFKMIPLALSLGEQKFWLEKSFVEYMRPPHTTNLDALYEGLPTEGIHNCPEEQISVRSKEGKVIVFDREKLLRKIRWVTLGYQYNWTTKEYNFDEDPVPFPPELAQYCRDLCSVIAFGDDYRAEAGIVNYYQLGDTLTSHVDRSERNMAAPLLSLSLGSSCVFLVGGAGREDGVVPVVLGSGDISILSGPARSFYHGVPKIMPGTVPAELVESCPAIRDARININIRQVT